MGLVRAKRNVFLNEYGYHAMGTEFDYVGPDNENLESVEAGPYAGYGEAQLRSEIQRRGLIYVAVATQKDLQAVLLEDDGRAAIARVEPKPKKPKQEPRGDEPLSKPEGATAGPVASVAGPEKVITGATTPVDGLLLPPSGVVA